MRACETGESRSKSVGLRVYGAMSESERKQCPVASGPDMARGDPHLLLLWPLP